jgi:hypothetical protein
MVPLTFIAHLLNGVGNSVGTADKLGCDDGNVDGTGVGGVVGGNVGRLVG